MRLRVLLVTLAITVTAMGCGHEKGVGGDPAASGVIGGEPPASGVIQWGTSAFDQAIGVAVAADGHVWVGGAQYYGRNPTNHFTMRRFTASGAVDLDEVSDLPTHGWFGFAVSTALGTPFSAGVTDQFLAKLTPDGEFR